MCHKKCQTFSMHAVPLRQFRNARQLKAWLRVGKIVELRDRGRVIARIIPAPSSRSSRKPPDFAAIRRKIFGNRILPGSDLLLEERGRF